MARLYTSTSFRPIINERLDPVADEKKETVIVGRTSKEQKREGFEGLLDVGVVCEKQASGTSYNGYRVSLDAKFPHIVFICGKRGSGKSYTLGVLAEELCRTKIGIGTVIVDPIGIYWSMKKGNKNKKEISELEKWGLKPEGLENVRILGPPGLYGPAGNILDGHFTIKPAELTSEEWCLVFGLDRFKIQGLLIGEALEKVREGYKVRKGPNEVEFIPGRGSDYGIEDIIDAIDRDVDLGSEDRGYARTTRRSVIARFKAAQKWGVFSETGTNIEEISVWDQVTVIDVSHPKLENQIRALVVGILAKKILQARIMSSRMDEIGVEGEGSRIPVTWLMIDEAHLLIPRRGLTAASKPLIEYAKLGRKPGCALVLATQRPAATDDDILSQVDVLVGHSLGLEDDIAALLRRVPAKLTTEMADSDFIRGIPSGFGLLADQKTQQRAMLIQIRPRMTHHSGKEATPMKQVIKPVEPVAAESVEASHEQTAIRSIWGDSSVRVEGDAETDEEFEILQATADVEVPAEETDHAREAEDVGLEALGMPEPEAEPEGEVVEAVPEIVVGDEATRNEGEPYADEVIMQVTEEDEWVYEETPTESEGLAGEEPVGLAALDEPSIPGEEAPRAEETEEVQVAEDITVVAPEIQAAEGEEKDCFPIILRRDSAKGLAIKGMRTKWTGRPREYIESIELVQLPMFEVNLTATRKKRMGGKVLVKTRMLFDAYMREVVTDFRGFARSKGVVRISGLTGDLLNVLSCVVAGVVPEEYEAGLDMQRADVRENIAELAAIGIVQASEDKRGYLRTSLSKDIAYPNRPEIVKGDLPSYNPIRVGRPLEQRIDEESLMGLLAAIYPGYEVESMNRVFMPYYEVTYTSERGSRVQRINAFTGLFEELDPGAVP